MRYLRTLPLVLLLGLPLQTACALSDVAAPHLTPRASYSLAVDTTSAQLDSAVAQVTRHVARWDSAAASVVPNLERYCRTKGSAGYLCGAGNALDLLRALVKSGQADTAKAVTPPIVVVPPVDSTPADTTVVADTTTGTDTTVTQQGGPSPDPVPLNRSHPFAPPSNGAQLAELPRDTVNVAYPAINRRYLCTNLQACLDTAKTGDEILLAPGSVYRNIRVNPTARTGWIVVRTNVTDVQLGGPWERMTQAKASALNLATITSSTTDLPLTVTSSAHHVRFDGVRFTTTSPTSNQLIRIGLAELVATQEPHHIALIRSFGDPGSNDVRRCITPDGAYIAIVSSSFVNCHSRLGDGQCINMIHGKGPLRVENNTCQGSHQSIMTGGGDPAIVGQVPSDLVIRRNDFSRPAAWFWSGGFDAAGNHAYPGNQWPGKTNIEIKIGSRILVEGNVVSHTIPDQQVGAAFNIKSTNQSGACTWCYSADVTVRYNRVVGAGMFMQLSGAPDNPAVPLTRVTTYGNEGDSISVGPYKGDTGDALQIGGVNDVVFQDTWIRNPLGRSCIYSINPNLRFVGRGIVCGGEYRIRGEGGLAYTLPGSILTNNTVEPWGTPFASWPAVLSDATRAALLNGVVIP